MKRNILNYLAVFAAGCLCCGAGLRAGAVTIEDCNSKAVEIGLPADVIEQGNNAWADGTLTSDALDSLYDAMCSYEQTQDEYFSSIFESSPDSSAQSEPDRTGSSADSLGDAGFVNMTLEEKIAYVNSLPPAEREAFLAGLSVEERNSIIKQLPAEDKMELLEGYMSVADAMGLHVTVDSLTDDELQLVIRNQDGTVVDTSSVGVTIDETGITYTRYLTLAAAAAVLAVLGLGALYRHLRHSDPEEE